MIIYSASDENIHCCTKYLLRTDKNTFFTSIANSVKRDFVADKIKSMKTRENVMT